MAFRKATRRNALLRLALCGPAGCGKTYSALLLAKGLVLEGETIALLDTEAGSGELYADDPEMPDYDYDFLDPPFDPARYIEKIEEAERAGYSVLIVDSLSHAWAGIGGILEIKDVAGATTKNDWGAWRVVTPQHNALVDKIMRCGMHVIANMRTKTAWDVVDDEGKKKPVKIGLKPEQREGLEYEFTTVLDLSVMGHVATSGKDRTHIFDGRQMVITEEIGKKLRAWIDEGESLSEEEAAAYAVSAQSAAAAAAAKLGRPLGGRSVGRAVGTRATVPGAPATVAPGGRAVRAAAPAQNGGTPTK